LLTAKADPAEHGEVAEAKWIAVGTHTDFIGKWIPGMNRRTRDYLAKMAGKRRLGIVNMDYPELPADNDLVARLIESNF
jgi:1-phosphatidylinositol phosphodiesterase